jgi:hypothetical protein
MCKQMQASSKSVMIYQSICKRVVTSVFVLVLSVWAIGCLSMTPKPQSTATPVPTKEEQRDMSNWKNDPSIESVEQGTQSAMMKTPNGYELYIASSNFYFKGYVDLSGKTQKGWTGYLTITVMDFSTPGVFKPKLVHQQEVHTGKIIKIDHFSIETVEIGSDSETKRGYVLLRATRVQ